MPSNSVGRKVVIMQHVPMTKSAKRAFRATICPVCQLRPPGSEAMGPMIPRVCEPTCALFLHADKLEEIAEAAPADRPLDYELAIQNQICNGCCVKPTAGDYCAHRLNCTCPLTCFAGQAVAILEGLVHAAAVAQLRGEQSGKQQQPATKTAGLERSMTHGNDHKRTVDGASRDGDRAVNLLAFAVVLRA